MSQLLSPITLINRLLIFHSAGSGKTCAAIAIAEEYIRIKPKSKVLVITKNKLGSINFRKDIPKCSTQFGEHSSSETVSIEDDDDDLISQVSTEEKRRKKEERVTFGSIGKKYQFTTHITFANKELTEEKMSESIDKYKDKSYNN